MGHETLQNISIVASLALGAGAMWQTYTTNQQVKCLQEEVPKQMARLQSLEALRQSAIASNSDFLQGVMGLLTTISTSNRDPDAVLPPEDQKALLDGIARAYIDFENFRNGIAPYLTADERADVLEKTTVRSISGDASGPDEAIQKLKIMIEDVQSVQTFMREFTDQKIGTLAEPGRIAAICG